MEVEVLSRPMRNKAKISKKAVRREACRVVAAFGVRFFGPLTFNPDKRKIDSHFHGRTRQQVEVTWVLDLPSARWITIYVFGGGGEDERYASIRLTEKGYFYLPHIDPQYNAIMARGLYRLGFDNPVVLAELNHPLSAHEKLELRLLMPREFWAQTWLDEGAAAIAR